MIERLTPFILLSTLTFSQHKGVEQNHLTLLKPGDDFSMICSIDSREAGLIYWYRMSLEPIIQTIVEGSFQRMALHKDFQNPRFNITKLGNQNNIILYRLSVFNITKKDEASYFCQAGPSYRMAFINATFLMVLDEESFRVDQEFSASAPLGGSVQLNCSLLSKDSPGRCPSKRNVHWFRSGADKSTASTIFTYKNRTGPDEEDEKKCVYSLTATLSDSSDSGMYYCAVATCGQILFGKGTRVEASGTSHLLPVCVTLGLLLLCSVVLNALMFWQRRGATHFKGSITTPDSTEALDRIEDHLNSQVGSDVNYVALEFPLRTGRRKYSQNPLYTECFYSATQDYRRDISAVNIT